jgi:hypothetical protein
MSLGRLARGRFSTPRAGLTASRLLFTASDRIPDNTTCARDTVVTPLPARTMPAIHDSTPSTYMSATLTAPQRGMTWTRYADSNISQLDGAAACFLRASQSVASSPTVARPSAGATYSPRAMETSTVAANSSASRLVVNPRFCVER